MDELHSNTEANAIKERLDAVVEHPEYPASLTVTPSASHLYAGSGCFIVFGLIFALVALALGDGQRRELEARGKLYGQLARDDIGVAYIRARALLDFRRLAS